MTPDYELVPEAIPPIASTYQQIIEEFLAGSEASVRVVMDRKPGTVLQGLLKAKRANGRFSAVSVVRRGETIYLRR